MSKSAGVAAWEALLRVHAALVPQLARELEDAIDVPLNWYDVLLELEREPGRQLRMQDLGARVVLSRSRVSRIVDDLLDHGLVTKSADPTDGRASLAAITAAGRRTLRRAAPIYLAGIQRHFTAHLTASQIAAMEAGLRSVLAAQDD